MDRASDSGSEGWGFESLPVYHEKAPFGVLFQLNPPLRVGETIFDDEILPWVG